MSDNANCSHTINQLIAASMRQQEVDASQDKTSISKSNYLTTNGQQGVEQYDGGQDCYDNFGVVIPDRRPESQHQN